MYPNGTRAQFASPVPTSGDFQPTFSVVDARSVECGSYSSGGFSLGVLTVGTALASLQQEPRPRARLTCRDGDIETVAFDTPYSGFTASTSVSPPIFTPGYNATYGPTSVRIQLLSEGSKSSPSIVNCMQR